MEVVPAGSWLSPGCLGLPLNLQGMPSLWRSKRSPQGLWHFRTQAQTLDGAQIANNKLGESLVFESLGFSHPSQSVRETAVSLRWFLTLRHQRPESLGGGYLNNGKVPLALGAAPVFLPCWPQQPHSTAAAACCIPQVLPIKLVIAYNGVSWLLHASKSHIIWLWGLKRRLGGGRDAVGLGAGVSTQSRAARPIHSPWPPPTRHSRGDSHASSASSKLSLGSMRQNPQPGASLFSVAAQKNFRLVLRS